MSSNFASAWQKHTTGNSKQTRHIAFDMFILYLVKTSRWQCLRHAPRSWQSGASGPRDTALQCLRFVATE